MPSDVGRVATLRTTLRPDDIEAALALSDAAGWNQTADDWIFFIDRGALGERHPGTGRIVATAASLGYGAFGWISMVLVATEHRHRGLAGRLVEAAAEALRATGAVPVLDATPAGHPVYAAAGFSDGFVFERWERAATAAAAPGPALPDAAAGPTATASGPARLPSALRQDDIAGLDAAASGLDRGEWFADVTGRPGTVVLRDGVRAFALLRAGRRALQIGPVVADDETTAVGLVDRALAVAAGARMFIDVPVARRALLGHLERMGFARQRAFTRMARGGAPPPLGPNQFAFAGPEFG